MGEREAETHHHHQQQQNQTKPSRLGLRQTGGQIVEVEGGHIVRSIGRKDRHSKVYTAKGTRDRRVRLAAHTAIQFYDVQDRLGYDRPSKAVDWLIKKAKTSIDELAELPAWKPTSSNVCFDQNQSPKQEEEPQQQPFSTHHGADVVDVLSGISSNRRGATTLLGMSNGNTSENNSSFLPSSLDSDAIADTSKSFFPMGDSAAESNSSAMQFQTFPPPPDFLSRASSHSQDLRLSLQSFQDPILLHHQPPPQHQDEQSLFSATTSALGYDAPSVGWWNGGGDTAAAFGGGGGRFIFNSPPFLFGQPNPNQNQNQNQNQFVSSQRGPLQSSNTQSVRARIDHPSSIADYHHQHHHHGQLLHSIGFESVGEFSGFRIPARIQGEHEEHDGVSDKPSSASSDSRH